ncbi:hypothetical protein BX600DRAFT_513508 [Xylariales sp. PMI_506]|nr:hypothetical protein BX600DRAFT_513508 [Xylariales sp. PMI_506]
MAQIGMEMEGSIGAVQWPAPYVLPLSEQDGFHGDFPFGLNHIEEMGYGLSQDFDVARRVDYSHRLEEESPSSTSSPSSDDTRESVQDHESLAPTVSIAEFDSISLPTWQWSTSDIEEELDSCRAVVGSVYSQQGTALGTVEREGLADIAIEGCETNTRGRHDGLQPAHMFMENDQKSDATPRSRPDSVDRPHQLLACPFYKRDSQRHRDCRRFGLRRIKDVKQHIYRRHKRPDFYCPRCFGKFDDTRSRDEHIRANQCNPQADPHTDRISEDKKKELAHYSGRSKSTEEQWFAVWDKLFPDADKPQSPYVEDQQQEMVHLFRRLWDDHRSEITSSVLNAVSSPALDIKAVSLIMSSVLDSFENLSSLSTPPEANLLPSITGRRDKELNDGQAEAVAMDIFDASAESSHQYDWDQNVLLPFGNQVYGDFVPVGMEL